MRCCMRSWWIERELLIVHVINPLLEWSVQLQAEPNQCQPPLANSVACPPSSSCLYVSAVPFLTAVQAVSGPYKVSSSASAALAPLEHSLIGFEDPSPEGPVAGGWLRGLSARRISDECRAHGFASVLPLCGDCDTKFVLNGLLILAAMTPMIILLGAKQLWAGAASRDGSPVAGDKIPTRRKYGSH
ncbi:hypothetical protein FB451DRAFT_1183251 [Mycena latifolia]|nr:hypothetical protein FB451DRAFT_1183251 [Mycena latifolia]